MFLLGHSAEHLKILLHKAPIVLAGSTLISTGLRFVSSIILTRLLVPEAFALIGLVTTIMFVIEMISDFGFKSYLLKHSTIATRSLVSNLWIIQIARGICLALLTLAVGELIDIWIDVPGISLGVQIAGLLFLINGFASFAPFLSEKKGNVIKPILLDFIASLVGIIAVLAITYTFRSAWSVIIGSLIAPMISMIFSHACYPPPVKRIKLSWNKSADFFHWSKYIIPSSIVTIIVIQLDKFVLAKTITAAELGLYFIAMNISALGTRFITEFSRRVLASQLAVKQKVDNDELSKVFYTGKHVTLCIAAAGVAIIAFYSEPIIGFIYDDRYSGVASFLTLLMLRPALCIWTYPLETFLVTKGQVRATLVGNLLRLIWIIITVPFAMRFGDSSLIILAFITAELPVVCYFFCKVNQFKGVIKLRDELIYPIIIILVGFSSTIALY